MSDQRPPINIHIRDLRRERSLTQEELAEALGLSRQSINAMEAGRCLPSLPVAFQLASYFAVPLTAVFGMSELQGEGQETSRALVPWSPLRDLVQAAQASGPLANISDLGDEVLVELFLPGFRQDELELEVGEDFLLVAGKGREDDGRQYFRREFVQRGFQRSLSLPAVVQSELAQAEMRHGVLSVRIPKKAKEKPPTTRIAISAGE